MKSLKVLLAATTFMFLVSATLAEAEMGVIYGPVYVSKAKESHHDKETKFKFAAPVAGKGVVVVKNGGDSGEKARVSAAKVELNDKKILRERDFNKNVGELRVDVELNDSNELEVEVKSCKECEISITVLGEIPVVQPPAPPAPPTRPLPPLI